MFNKKLQSDKDKRKQELLKRISQADKVKSTVMSAGWVEIIQPLIEEKIIGIIGGQKDGVWQQGKLHHGAEQETLKYNIGYKQFGIELLNIVNGVSKQGEMARKQLEMLAQDKEVYTKPMLDTQYAPEGRDV